MNVVEVLVGRLADAGEPLSFGSRDRPSGTEPVMCTPAVAAEAAAAAYEPAAVQLAAVGVAAAAFSFLAGHAAYHRGATFEIDDAAGGLAGSELSSVSALVDHRRRVLGP